jgi:hypothetical protein
MSPGPSKDNLSESKIKLMPLFGLILLETLGNDRTACIAFEDGTYSADFELKCGRAQGNTSSPTEYNMGQQILLFKIELCPEIKSLYQSHFISRPIAQAPVEHFFPPPPQG